MPYRIRDVDRLRELVNAVLLVGSDLDLPTVLRRIVESARTLVDAEYAALGVLDEDGDALEDFITVGMTPDEVRRIGRLPEGHGLLGLLIVEPRPVRVRDVADHPDTYGFPPHHPRMHSFLGVPVHVRGEVFGNLYLTDKQGAEEFSEEDEALVLGLAIAAGVAIENARMHARLRDVVLLEDRERIARDLHDTVIQRLFATGLTLQATSRMAGEVEVRRRLQDSVEDLDTTIRQIRSTIFALETVGVGGTGVRAEVLGLARELAPMLGFEPRIRFDGPVDTQVGNHVAEHLLSALRETLTNVARHAGASSVEIDVEVEDEAVLLTVADNGRGLPEELRAEGRGLRNLDARAAELGGTFSVGHRPGGGVMVRWTVPIRAEGPERPDAGP